MKKDQELCLISVVFTVCLLYLFNFTFVIFGSIHSEVFASFVFIPQNVHICSLGYILSFVIVCFLLLHHRFYKHNLILRSAKVCVLVFQLEEISGPSVNYLFRIIKLFSLLSCCGTFESL